MLVLGDQDGKEDIPVRTSDQTFRISFMWDRMGGERGASRFVP